MRKPLLSYVVITRNRKEDLHCCLRSIETANESDYEIIVVDNASQDDTLAMLAQDFASATVLAQPHNTGVAGGRNIGMAKARGEYIICLDDDCTFPDTQTDARIRDYFARHREVGVLSFNILDPKTLSTHPRTIPRRDKRMLNEDTLLGYFLGGGFAVRRDLWHTLGGFWEELNPYGAEEMDMSMRVLDAGQDILWTSRIRIIHHESPISRPTGRKIHAMARNHPLCALKNLPWPQVITHYAMWWGYAGWLALKSGHPFYWLTSLASAIKAMPRGLAVRKAVSHATQQKLRARKGPYWY